MPCAKFWRDGPSSLIFLTSRELTRIKIKFSQQLNADRLILNSIGTRWKVSELWSVGRRTDTSSLTCVHFGQKTYKIYSTWCGAYSHGQL